MHKDRKALKKAIIRARDNNSKFPVVITRKADPHFVVESKAHKTVRVDAAPKRKPATVKKAAAKVLK